MEHLPGLIQDLALILMAAAVVTLIFKRIKQPIVLGYIIAGFLVGPYLSLTPTVVDSENVETLAQIGVIFLLFSLGLEFSFKKLLRVGGAASTTAFVEITFIVIAGYYTGRLMGWNFIDSIFLGGMLASSSTTIIIKAFDELGMKTRQYASIVFGALIVEDIVVILLMVLLSTVAVTEQFEGSEMLFTIGKLFFFLILWFVIGVYLIPTLLKKAKKYLDEETLLVLAVGLCLGMVVAAVAAGFSSELGAFIMGSILAETTKAEKIIKVFEPVRDLFASIFFVSIGMMIDPAVIVEYKWPVLIVTLLTLVGKLFSSAFGALLSGQSLKTSVEVGMSMAQIGEFAFIVATLGLTLGVISPFLFPIAVGASAITTFTTPYMIKSSDRVYDYIDRNLPAYIKNKLDNYASGARGLQTESKWKSLLISYAKVIAVNGIFLLALSIISSNVINPFFENLIGNTLWSKIASLVLSLALAAPFLWALVIKRPNTSAFKTLWSRKDYSRGPLLIIELFRLAFGVVFISSLVGNLFSSIGFLIALPLITILLLLSSKRIQRIYQRLENRFLTNLNEREIAENEKNLQPRLFSPESNLISWEAHIVDLEVNPHAVYIGKRLFELKWRENYGVNIAYIKRGDRVIYAPDRYNRLLPFDHVGIIATDDQMEQFQKIFDEEIVEKDENRNVDDVVLFKLEVNSDKELEGKSIRDSKIRKKTNGLVVGIERNHKRILNPDSNAIFENGDIVWIVGDRQKLQHLNLLEQNIEAGIDDTEK